jgi:hypothetical protein
MWVLLMWMLMWTTLDVYVCLSRLMCLCVDLCICFRVCVRLDACASMYVYVCVRIYGSSADVDVW